MGANISFLFEPLHAAMIKLTMIIQEQESGLGQIAAQLETNSATDERLRELLEQWTSDLKRSIDSNTELLSYLTSLVERYESIESPSTFALSSGSASALIKDDREGISIDIYIDTENENSAARIFGIVDELAVLLGAENIELQQLRRGSFFRRSKAKLAAAATDESVFQRLKTIERALELWQVGSRQAEVDQKSSDAVSRLVGALNDVPRACIRIGSILLVKYQDSSGPVLLTRQLSQPEIWAFERYPELQKHPENIISALALVLAEHPELRGELPSLGENFTILVVPGIRTFPAAQGN